MKLTRRSFLKASAGAFAAASLAARAEDTAAPARKTYRAAVIGWTGRGDYGHGYDRIFSGRPDVSVEAVADPDDKGRKAARTRSGARRDYADYRVMLEKEKPDLVAIAMRHPDTHVEPATAAIEAGSHLFVEKPLAASPSACDAILAAAERRGARIVVAHHRRYAADFLKLKTLLDEGLIGRVREVRINGKQDRRSGGEDLMVLGAHDFDMARMFFGDPLWCTATVLEGGQPARREQARDGKEPIRVLGDTIHASFGFPNNVCVHWSSVRTGDDWNTRPVSGERWGFEILGSRGVLAYRSGVEFGWLDSPFLLNKGGGPAWKPLPQPKDFNLPPHRADYVSDLIHAVETGVQPFCSGADGRWAVEMACAVHASHLSASRLDFPLKNRTHPLDG